MAMLIEESTPCLKMTDVTGCLPFPAQLLPNSYLILKSVIAFNCQKHDEP